LDDLSSRPALAGRGFFVFHRIKFACGSQRARAIAVVGCTSSTLGEDAGIVGSALDYVRKFCSSYTERRAKGPAVIIDVFNHFMPRPYLDRITKLIPDHVAVTALVQMFGHDACQNVSRSTGREWYDQCDGTLRIDRSAGVSERRGCRKTGHARENDAPTKCRHWFPFRMIRAQCNKSDTKAQRLSADVALALSNVRFPG
jgi:hypothetical protein